MAQVPASRPKPLRRGRRSRQERPNATHLLALPMPLRCRIRRKTSRRAQQLAIANLRARRRRVAVHGINALVRDLGLPLRALRPKAPKPAAFERVLRVLVRRCTTDAMSARLQSAVREWAQNGGNLPGGIALTEESGAVPAEGAEGEAAFVPRHKILRMDYRLESSAFMMTYNSTTFQPGVWREFKDFIVSLARQYGAKAWAACLEESQHAQHRGDGGQTHHTHAYLIWTDGLGLRLRDLAPLTFRGVRPRVDQCTARGTPGHAGAPRQAALHGLWYVAVKKEGTVHAASNFLPWRKYKPCVAWLTSLWDSHKMSHGRFLELSAAFRSGHSKRKRDVDDVERTEKATAVAAHAHAQLEALRETQPLQPVRDFPAVDAFVAAFATPARRRPILAIVGGTNVGKSLLAAHVLGRVGMVVGVTDFKEVTVQDDHSIDFSEFDHRVHAGILLDGVGDVLTLWRNREVLQGRPKVTRGGRSATMVYSYPFCLAQRAVVATFDLTAQNLHLLRLNHWLREPHNVITLHLDAPAWAAAPEPGMPCSRTPEDEVRTWTVSEVATFYAQQDAAAIGERLASNSVNGADLLTLESPARVSAELQLSLFTAKKVLALRDAFLRNGIARL